MKHEVVTKEFEFDVIAAVLTGKRFAKSKDMTRFAKFLGATNAKQMLADRDSKWIPWLLVQLPLLEIIDTSTITDNNADWWLEKESKKYRGAFSVRTVRMKA